MVAGDPALFLLRPLKLREVGDKEELVVVFVPQPQHVADVQPQRPQHPPDRRQLVGAEEDKVPRFGADGLDDRPDVRFGEVFGQDRVDLPVRPEGNPGHPAGAVALGFAGQLVDGRAGEGAAAGDADRPDHPAGVGYLPEDREAADPGDIGDVDNRQPEADVRLVGSVEVHRLLPGHPGEGLGDVQPLHLPHDPLKQALEMSKNILLLDKGHLHVHLGKLRLAVGPEVLVPEAAGDLVIPVDPADHQELLVDLGGLGEGVEAAGVDPAGDQVVPGPFRGGFAEHRGFDV